MQLALVGNTSVLHPTHVLGRATELRAEAELLERGFEVAVPSFDAGFDLLVNGWRVQVKGANRRENGSAGATQYVFSIKRELRADFLLCRGPQDDAWWVIPASVVPAGHRVCVNVSPDPPNPGGRGRPAMTDYSVYRDAWGLLRAGRG